MKSRKLVSAVAALAMAAAMFFTAVPPARAASTDGIDQTTLIARAIYYEQFGDGTEVERTVKALSKLSEDDGVIWNKIVDFWNEMNEQLDVHDAVPTDLPTSGHAFVVLGYGLAADGSMRDVMLGRLWVALAAAKAYPESKLVLTGGKPQAAMTEAQVMYDWLVQHGVDSQRLIVEPNSVNTQQNAEYSMAKMYEMGDITRYTIISSGSHIRRASVLFYTASLEAQRARAAATFITPVQNVALIDDDTSEAPPSDSESSLIASNMANLLGVSSTYDLVENDPPDVSLLSSLSVTAPDKTSYQVGDTLDTTGLTATADYDFGNYSRDVTSEVSIRAIDRWWVGAQTVAVTYTEGDITKTATFDVDVDAYDGSHVSTRGSGGGSISPTIDTSVVAPYSSPFSHRKGP